jgi:uncharacterized protein with GYD domain
MFFVTLTKFKKKLGKAELDKTTEIIRTSPKVKVQAIYWTFGRFDAVLIAEAPDEKTYMKFAIQFHDYATTETLLGVPREEAIKLV